MTRLLRSSVLAAVAALSFALPGSARAETLAFSLSFGFDTFSLENGSTTAQIDRLVIDMNGAPWRFDAATGAFTNGSGSATLISPDRLADDEGSDKLIYDFSGFLPGDRFVVAIGLDTAAGAPGGGISGALFNNGAAPNATVFLTFSGSALELGYGLPDTIAGADDPYATTTCGTLAASSCRFAAGFDVPEPGVAWLALAALAVALARPLLQLL